MYQANDGRQSYPSVAWSWSGQPDIIHQVIRRKIRLPFTFDDAKTPTEIPYGEQIHSRLLCSVKNNQYFKSLETVVNHDGMAFRRSKYEIAGIPTVRTMRWSVFADGLMIGEQSIEMKRSN